MKIAEFLEKGLEDNSEYKREDYAEVGLEYSGNDCNRPKTASEVLYKVKQEINEKLQDENFIEENLINFGNEFEFARDLYFIKIDKNPKINQSFENLIIKTGNVIGKINMQTTNTANTIIENTLKIKSRFGNQFLHYLLAYTEGFLELEDLGAYSEENDLYWALIYLWKSKLKQAYRSGLPKLYETKQKELNKIKGSLNLKEQFKKPYDNGQYHCQYR